MAIGVSKRGYSNHIAQFKAPARTWCTLDLLSFISQGKLHKQVQYQSGEQQPFPQEENIVKLHSKGYGCVIPLDEWDQELRTIIQNSQLAQISNIKCSN